MAADPQSPKHLASRDEIDGLPEAHIRHPWNPNSDVYLKRLSPIAGLSPLSLSIARVPPGKTGFLYHRRERGEAFVLILSGHGRADGLRVVRDRRIDVGAARLEGEAGRR